MSTSSQLDSRVSRSALLAGIEARLTSGTSGPRRSESFAWWDRDSHCWRTFQGSLLTDTLEPYSGTWPKQGTMRSGSVYEPLTSAPHTDENGSSLWPTATTDSQSQRTERYAQGGMPLSAKAAMWPTAKGSADKMGQPRENDRGDIQAAAIRWHTPRAIYGEHPGMTDEYHLTGQAVGMWPTPDTQGNRDGSQLRSAAKGSHAVSLHHKASFWPTPKIPTGGPEARASRAQRGSGGEDLQATARDWPTPTTRDHKDGTSAGTVEENALLGRAAPNSGLQAQRTGKDGHECSPKCRQLNPRFVEWLQGFPIGHTDLAPLETA